MSDNMNYREGELKLVEELSRMPFPNYLGVKIDAKDFVFMLPRKCASNSIKEALIQMGDRCSFPEVFHNFTMEELRNYPLIPRIAFVRHPVDRLISAYRHGVLRDQGFYRLEGLYPYMPWTEFVDNVCGKWNDPCANYHFVQYSHELIDFGQFPNYVVKIERLEDDWNTIARAFDWPKVTMRTLNRTKDVDIDVTQEQLERLEIRYRADATNFGYDILSWSRKDHTK